MKPPVLLCYNLSGEKGRKIKMLAMRLTLRVRQVSPDEYGQTLASLCGLEAPQPSAAPENPFTDEMLVLAHFQPELLNRFLYAYRKDGIEPVSLKAVLTDTNMGWSSIALHEQLAEEHRALAEGNPPAYPSDQERS